MKTALAMAICFCAANTLQATVSPYIGFGLGGVSAKDARYSHSNGSNTQTGNIQSGGGAVLDLAAGLDFDDVPLRIEGDFSVLFNKLDAVTSDSLGGIAVPLDGSGMAVSSFMLNAYFDFGTGSRTEPYVFAGIGRATVYHSMDNIDIDDQVGAGQIGAGLGVIVTDYFIIDLKYRYFATDDDYTVSNGTETLKADFASHQFIVGFRVRF